MYERHNVDRAIFENEIFPANQPVVIRGLLQNWPAVQAGKQSLTSLADYFKRLDTGTKVKTYVGRPEINGRFFYTEDFRGFNFDLQNVSVTTALDTMVSLKEVSQPPAIALQAMDIPNLMPSFLDENPMPLVEDKITPRIWISNRSVVAPHFDINHNLACVVGGSRKFTLFPPEQVGNLYIGPLMTTPGGPPISTVDLQNPDYTKFPKFTKALQSAQQAVLEPGDAIYIPILWWHGVESLDSLNILVNYWWNNTSAGHHDPMLSLIHCMVLMSDMPESQREAWREFFGHFVFQKNGDPGAHLPVDIRDVMGKLSASDKAKVIALIAEHLKS